MGTRPIDSTPAATTMSYAPETTPWAAKLIACWLLPHWRSTVVPGTDSGKPAPSSALRVMFAAWSPSCVTAPAMTSSICAGSTPVRVTSSFRLWASRSTGRTSCSAPPALPFPTGVRTAPTITASRPTYPAISASCDSPLSTSFYTQLYDLGILETTQRRGEFHDSSAGQACRSRRMVGGGRVSDREDDGVARHEVGDADPPGGVLRHHPVRRLLHTRRHHKGR